MDICVVVLVKIPKRLDHRARLLRGRGAIEINQRMPMGPLTQNRKILANSIPIDRAGSFVHIIICYTHKDAPLYSDKRSRWLTATAHQSDSNSPCKASLRPHGDGYRAKL